MRNGIICDRCGEVIKDDPWNALSICGDVRPPLDLCIRCFSAFKTFMGIKEAPIESVCCPAGIDIGPPVVRPRKAVKP